ncbi:MAG: PilZ domain-containing protein [Proteobacteria bacterium]|nr:PilZ domain-containing protein [Pseudomonadota bacterium]
MSAHQLASVTAVTERELPLHGELLPDEQRDSVRVQAELPLEIPLPGNHQVRQVYTRNISRGGLMFRVTRPVRLPASPVVALTLPDGRTFVLSSEIRHAARVDGSDEVEVGVQFKAVPHDVDRALRAALSL